MAGFRPDFWKQLNRRQHDLVKVFNADPVTLYRKRRLAGHFARSTNDNPVYGMLA